MELFKSKYYKERKEVKAGVHKLLKLLYYNLDFILQILYSFITLRFNIIYYTYS